MRGNHRPPQSRGRTSWTDTSLRSRVRWHYLLAILVLFSTLFGSIPAAAKSDNPHKAQSTLLDEAQQSPDSDFRVIVKRHNGDTGADSAVENKGGKKQKDIAADSFVADVKGQDIASLSQDPSIDYVTIDAPMQVNEVQEDITDISQLKNLYPETVQATDVWDQGITGDGVGVAVIDTGVVLVKDFSGRKGDKGRVVAQQSFVDKQPPIDGYGHGTHVAGVIGGDSWRADKESHGKYVGIAPDSDLVNLRVADNSGQTYLSDVIDAIEWAIANRAQYNIRVINLSMTSTVPESYHTSLLAAAAERAWFSGILVVVSAGNNGPDSMYFSPADDPFVVTVGATDSNGTAVASDDWIAPWSSSGTNPDGVTKPDVVAPGRYIASTLADHSQFQKEYKNRIVDKKYIWMSGTSMSTAVVSGVAALIFQAHPDWTNDQVKWVLTQTATHLNVDPVSEGAGEVNAYAAVNYPTTPQFANQGLEINLNLIGPNGDTVYDNAMPAGSAWSGSAWSGSAWSGSAWSGSAWSGSAWSGSGWSGTQWANADGLE
jgi:serine protease AprX